MIAGGFSSVYNYVGKSQSAVVGKFRIFATVIKTVDTVPESRHIDNGRRVDTYTAFIHSFIYSMADSKAHETKKLLAVHENTLYLKILLYTVSRTAAIACQNQRQDVQDYRRPDRN